MTPEEVNAEKERLRLQEEEEQLMLAKELMGEYVNVTLTLMGVWYHFVDVWEDNLEMMISFSLT